MVRVDSSALAYFYVEYWMVMRQPCINCCRVQFELFGIAAEEGDIRSPDRRAPRGDGGAPGSGVGRMEVSPFGTHALAFA